MNSYDITPTITNASILATLTKTVDGFVKRVAVDLYTQQKKEHFFQRVNSFIALSKVIVQCRSKQMNLCLLWDGNDIFNAHYIELQLVDRKNTIVYAAATLEDN